MTEYKYDLTIIIPCHNVSVYAAPMLYSLINQKIYGYKVEILFVLDNCTDNSKDFITSYMRNKQYDVRFITCKSNHLVSIPRNEGIEKSQGRFIWIIDADDWIIDNLAITKILSVCKQAKDDRMIVLNFDYPSFFPYAANHNTTWQYVWSREFIGDSRFNLQPNDEDCEFVMRMNKKYGMDDNGAVHTPYIADKIYYYNFGRGGSWMTNRLLQNKDNQE